MAVTLDRAALTNLARWDEINPAVLRLASTLEDARFPGAIVPALRADGAAVFYALADTAPGWRRLQPLLVAFAGVTFTDFEGTPADLDLSDPLEHFLGNAGLHSVAIMRPGASKGAAAVALKALQSLQDAVSRAPELVAVRTEPTSVLLARLQDALNAGDVAAARAVHATLSDELRLDAQNLLQLEFQILAAAGEWAAIRSHPDFELLCASGPSPATAELLLEAMYWTHLADPMADASASAGGELGSLCRSLLRYVGRNPPAAVGEVIKWLSASDEASSPTAAPHPAGASAVPALVEAKPKGAGEEIDAASQARAALLSFAAAEGDAHLAAAALARDAFARLSESERQELLSRPIFQAAWWEIEAPQDARPAPTNWADWLSYLDDPDFDASAFARRAASDWRLPNDDVDPAVFADLASAIDAVRDGLAGDRLNQSLPYLVEWAAGDPQWPRTALCPAYLSLLTRIALSTRRGETTIKSAAVLLESALMCGLDGAEYRDAMEAVSVIATEALNRNTAYDVFELADVAIDFIPVEADALKAAVAAVVAAGFSLFERLTTGQRLACQRLASHIGWDAPISGAASEPGDEIAGALSSMTVGVYTLTETAGRNAQAVLASIAPSIKVELNHDHAATAVLGALVARADLFVVAWASSKHAATNFIKSRRGPKPLVYALGKGASSLIRAIEDYVAKPRPTA